MKNKKQKFNNPVPIRFSKAQAEKLIDAANKRQSHVSVIVREAVDYYLTLSTGEKRRYGI